jgi:5-bromo-4-chloroindolyl phosphate hydrolysis protein
MATKSQCIRAFLYLSSGKKSVGCVLESADNQNIVRQQFLSVAEEGECLFHCDGFFYIERA